ncbi:uncharacterized protein Dmul_29270 [Desulfococcus multivorans]|nr:uncharacterized protein Dmul_29270 [Desulfococcus multivorans]
MLKPDASKIGCSELLKENSNFHEKACQEKNASILSFLLNSYKYLSLFSFVKSILKTRIHRHSPARSIIQLIERVLCVGGLFSVEAAYTIVHCRRIVPPAGLLPQ